MHTGKYAGKFFGVALCYGAYGALIFWRGIFYEVECNFAAFFVKSVARAHIFQLHGGADIAGRKFVDRSLDLSANAEYLSQTFFSATCYILEVCSGLEGAAHYLKVAYFADVGFYGCLEHINAQRAVGIGFHLFAFGIDRRRHVFNEGNDVAKEFHHAAHAHVFFRAHAE